MDVSALSSSGGGQRETALGAPGASSLAGCCVSAVTSLSNRQAPGQGGKAFPPVPALADVYSVPCKMVTV